MNPVVGSNGVGKNVVQAIPDSVIPDEVVIDYYCHWISSAMDRSMIYQVLRKNLLN